jgi:ubiquinone/menaquinone biosynthesis C-methylase UbiE
VAAGTGIVTMALDRALPAGAAILATDLNQGMIDHAAGKFSSPRVSWRAADGQALPFEDGQFEALVCQFGVMFFPDRAAGYREAKRVLEPGGHYLVNVWDSLEANEAARTVHEAVAAQFPTDPPGFLARTPHAYHDAERIRGELAAAGFRDIQVDTVGVTGRAASAREPAIGFCQGTPLRGEIEARNPAALSAVSEAAARALMERFGAGPIEAPLQALVVSARA